MVITATIVYKTFNDKLSNENDIVYSDNGIRINREFDPTLFHINENRLDSFSEDSLDYYKYLEEVAYKLLSRIGVEDHWSETQSYLEIADWICDNCHYDKTLSSLNYDTLLEEGTSVCNGYAELVYLLASRCGIECWKVHGYYKGEYHAWNYINLDGVYYWSDITGYDSTGASSYRMSKTLWDDYEVAQMALEGTEIHREKESGREQRARRLTLILT